MKACRRLLFLLAGFPGIILAALDGGDGPNQRVLAETDFSTSRGSPPARHHHETSSAQHAWPPSPPSPSLLTFSPLEEVRHGLDVMQRTWFALWVGTWPMAIDWTAAVMNTHLVATLATFSKAKHSPSLPHHIDTPNESVEGLENDINGYFGQNIAYYFGENAFSLRYQAYDDMLWVVLGWLESIKTIKLHSDLHYPAVDFPNERWHGTQFIEAYAHRARVFYDLAAQGWDTKFCGGGMVWSPHLGPYKNAITNELFISASIGMYLYFPGDNITAPFFYVNDSPPPSPRLDPAPPQDPKHLRAAVDGYDWLANSGMTNRKGLYIDGFHITDWKDNGTKCDVRNLEVYTYNQGVILSGLRGLWESTGNATYLKDAHQLVRNVVNATGWSLDRDRPHDGSDDDGMYNDRGAKWSGLGRAGIMEERCDAAGRCDQTPQTFKGIFFHHLASLCEPLPTAHPLVPGKTFVADNKLARWHRQSCKSYGPWIEHNAKAALGSRDAKGRFGMWWGVNTAGSNATWLEEEEDGNERAIDYRNNPSELENDLWQPREGLARPQYLDNVRRRMLSVDDVDVHERFSETYEVLKPDSDPNDRGKGRTVEAQGGGVSVLRALWEIRNLD